MRRLVLAAFALALAAMPARAQDVHTMTASQYMDADVEVQHMVNGYFIGQYEAAGGPDGATTGACVRTWLASPSNGGPWGLSRKLHDAVTIAAFGSEGARPVADVIDAALRDTCP